MTTLPDKGKDEWSALPVPVPAQQSGEWRCTLCGCGPKDECEHVPCHNNHCPDCGQFDCMCCEGCDQYPCCCENSGEGSSKFRSTPPWEERGSFVPLHLSEAAYESWTDAWPILNNELLGHRGTDPCQAAADFYVLDAIRAGLINRDHDCNEGIGRCGLSDLARHDLRVIASRREAERVYGVLVEHLDALFMAYVDMAVGGELRHHPAVGGRSVSTNRRRAWAGWKYVREQLGPQALLDAGDLFRDWGSSGNTGYGGPLWAAPGEMLYARVTNQITPAQWVDRVFTFVHNGGVFLNKLNWVVKNRSGFQLDRLQQSVLPAHATDNFTLLLQLCSRDVVRLWDEQWQAMNRVRSSVGVRTSVNFRTNPRRRMLCRYCNSNPARGHLMTCPLVTGGSLKNSNWVMQPKWLQIVAEADWPHWNWSAWESDPMVKPDGSMQMQPDMMLNLQFSANCGAFYGELEINKRAKNAILHVFSMSDVIDTSLLSPGMVCNWKLSVMAGNVPIGSLMGKATSDIEKFKAITVHCGLVLPVATPKVSWDALDQFAK